MQDPVRRWWPEILLVGALSACVAAPAMAQVNALSFESVEEVNQIGRLQGAPQPVSINELRRVLECPSLDADASLRVLDTMAAYRIAAARIRERELLPGAIQAMGPASTRAEGQALFADGVEKRRRLDQGLFADLRALTTDATCAALLDDIRGAIERRMIRERVGASHLLAFDIEIGPILRGSFTASPVLWEMSDRKASDLSEETRRAAEAVVTARDRALLSLLQQLEESVRDAPANQRAALEARGVARPSAEERDPAVHRQYNELVRAVANEVLRPARDLAVDIGRHQRETLNQLQPLLPEHLWRRVRGQVLARMYGGPFVVTPQQPLLCVARALHERPTDGGHDAGPLDEVASIMAAWRLERDTLELALADAIDLVRGSGDDTAALVAAASELVSSMESLDARTRASIAGLGFDCPDPPTSTWKPADFGIRRVRSAAEAFPPSPSSRGFVAFHSAVRPAAARGDLRGQVQPLDVSWVDHLLDTCEIAPEDPRREVGRALIEETRRAAQPVLEANAERMRTWDTLTQSNFQAAEEFLRGSRDVQEQLEHELARLDEALFDNLRALIKGARSEGWGELLIELADRDRRRLGRRIEAGPTNHDVAPGTEATVDLVRLIDESPELARFRSADHPELNSAVLAILRNYGQRMSAAIDAHVAATRWEAEQLAETAQRPPKVQGMYEALAELAKINREALNQLVAVVDLAHDRTALKECYRRAAWPDIFVVDPLSRARPSFKRLTGESPTTLDFGLLPAAQRSELDRVDDSITTLLMASTTSHDPKGPPPPLSEIAAAIWTLDGWRWQREEILLELLMRQAILQPAVIAPTPATPHP